MNLKANLSLLNPYDYSPVAESFHFTTKNEITYSLALGDFSSSFGVPENSECKLIFFILTPINSPDIIPIDYRVKDTVVSFLIEYLSKHENVIFYVYSAIDQKEIKRQKAFNRWYDHHKPDHLSREIKIVDGTNAHFIFNNGNNIVQQVFTAIDDYNTSYNS